MVMTWSKEAKMWVSDYVESSATLDYYQSHSIMEAIRLPSWVHMEAIANMCNNHTQIAELVKSGYDFMMVTVGNYKSICFSVLQSDLHLPHRNNVRSKGKNKKLNKTNKKQK